MASKENYNEPLYENLKLFKGLELVYRHPCIHLRTENMECANCKYGLNNNCVIHNEYLKIKKDFEILEIFKNSDYLVIHKDDDTFILSFNVKVDDIDDFTFWKNEIKKK